MFAKGKDYDGEVFVFFYKQILVTIAGSQAKAARQVSPGIF